jgi:hypothetical protein
MKAYGINNYELHLKNEKIKSYNQVTFFILLINLSLFVLFAIQSPGKQTKIFFFAAAVILLVLLVLRFLSKKSENNISYIYSYAGILLASTAWIIIGKWWAGAVCFFLFVFYQLSRKDLSAQFNSNYIKYTSFPVRSIDWMELNNVVLKDGILTLDFKSNKILQAEIDDITNSVNEKDFNDFCSQQLKERSKAK